MLQPQEIFKFEVKKNAHQNHGNVSLVGNSKEENNEVGHEAAQPRHGIVVKLA